ncbi:MAG: hypothetical protein CR993_00450 [Rhodobacterales bacterium]|nr:MAG: hypothetical protein CR993_00450 [Rhodobacterales bacterium]
MQSLFEMFIKEEEGSTTVDWIVLVAGVTLMVLSVMATMATGVEGLNDQTIDRMEAIGENMG